MTLKEKFVAFYKKVYGTDKEPSLLDIVKLANVLGQVLEHPQAEEELGSDVIKVLKKCTKTHRHDTEVNVTILAQEIGWYDNKQQEDQK